MFRMHRCTAAATWLLLLGGATTGRAQTVTFSVSDATFFPSPHGSYDNGGDFIHGVNKWTFDVLVTVPAEDDWTAASVEAFALAGTQWYYFEAICDPNLPACRPTCPGTSEPSKYSTFVSDPRSQTSSSRFTTCASANGCGVVFPPSGPTVEPTEFEVCWLEFPPASTSLDTNAAIVRLTIDLLGTPYEGQLVDLIEDAGDTRIAEVEVVTSTLQRPALSILVFNMYAGPAPCTGDLDADRDVDLSDLAILISNYGSTSATPEQGDLDGDADVDLDDLVALLAVYGAVCS